MKFSLEEYLRPKVANYTSASNASSAGTGIPRKGSSTRKYTSSTVVKASFSPHTIKKCRFGLHIQIKNYRRYSWARIKGHSKNFSNPQASKVA